MDSSQPDYFQWFRSATQKKYEPFPEKTVRMAKPSNLLKVGKAELEAIMSLKPETVFPFLLSVVDLGIEL